MVKTPIGLPSTPTTCRATASSSATLESSPRGYDLEYRTALRGCEERARSLPRLLMRSRLVSRRTGGGLRMPPTNRANSKSTFVRFRREMDNRWYRARVACSPSGGATARSCSYISADRKLMAVPVTTDGETFIGGCAARVVRRPNAGANRSVSDRLRRHDGWPAVPRQHRRRSATRPALTVILNWTAELKK